MTWPWCITQKAVAPQTPCGGEATFKFVCASSRRSCYKHSTHQLPPPNLGWKLERNTYHLPGFYQKPQKQYFTSTNTTELVKQNLYTYNWWQYLEHRHRTMTAQSKSTEVTAKSIKKQNMLLSTHLNTVLEISILDVNLSHITKNIILFKYCRKSYLR